MNLKYLIFIISTLLIIFVGYTNCAKKIDFSDREQSFNSSSVNLGQDCIVCDDQNTYLIPSNTKESVAEKTNLLNLDSRETYESFFHLLNYDYFNLTPTLNNQLASERNIRRALLAQVNNVNSMTSVNLLSQISIASEVCRLVIYDQISKNQNPIRFFDSIDLGLSPIDVAISEQESLKNWFSTVNSLTEATWGRTLNESESIYFKDFIQSFFNEYKSKSNNTAKDGTNGKNIQSLSLAISLCTAVLAAPEASLK